jgi:hypothetical protein
VELVHLQEVEEFLAPLAGAAEVTIPGDGAQVDVGDGGQAGRSCSCETTDGQKHTYRVVAVNTVGLKSKPSESAKSETE